MRLKYGFDDKKGVALIMAVGILSVVAVMAISFAFNMRMEVMASATYRDGVKAEYLAGAGIARAVADLKENARTDFVYNDEVSLAQDNLAAVNGSYTVTVEDEQRKININNANARLINNLVAAIGGGVLDDDTGNIIVNGRQASEYKTIDEIKTVWGDPNGDEIRDENETINNTEFDLLRPFITVNSYQDPNCANRSPININTADALVMRAVLAQVSDGVNTIDDTEATNLATYIADRRPYHSWTEFEDRLNGAAPGTISSAEVIMVRYACNPNRQKPHPFYITDFTTEFCFFSGGNYTITSTGRINNLAGNQTAEKVIRAIVRVYEMINETLDSQFDAAGTTKFKVTTSDDCPVESMNSANDWTFADWPNSSQRYVYYPDSIKLGFWDNFENEDFSTSVWNVCKLGNPAAIDDYDIINVYVGLEQTKKLQFLSLDNASPVVHLGPHTYGSHDPATEPFIWHNYSMRMEVNDAMGPIDRPDYFSLMLLPWWVVEPLFDRTSCTGAPGGRGIDNAVFTIQYSRNPTAITANTLADAGAGINWPVNCWVNREAKITERGKPAYSETRLITANTVNTLTVSPDWNPANLPTTLSRYVITGESWWGQSAYMIYGLVNWVWGQGAADFYYFVKDYNIVAVDHMVYGYVNNHGSLLGWMALHTASRVTHPTESGTIGVVSVGNKNEYVRTVDNVRIVPDSGYFISQPLNLANAVEWGTISATVTLTPASNADSETITLQTSIDNGTTWDASSGDSITSSNNSSIRYRAVLQTRDNSTSGMGTLPYYSDFPVLEDVFITYLPQTRYLYWREVSE